MDCFCAVFTKSQTQDASTCDSSPDAPLSSAVESQAIQPIQIQPKSTATTTTDDNQHSKQATPSLAASDFDSATLSIKEIPDEFIEEETEQKDALDRHLPMELINLIAEWCPHDALLMLAELDIKTAVRWKVFVSHGQDFGQYFGHDPNFWEMGGISCFPIGDDEFDAQLVSEIRFHDEIPLGVFEFPEYVTKRKRMEICDQKFTYEWMCCWFEEHVGSTRGLYHFLRHVCDLPVIGILTMTPIQILDRLADVPRRFDELYAACFYGLNGLARWMFEEMGLSVTGFVRKWEDALSGADEGYFRQDSLHRGRFRKVKLMWGNDMFAYMYVHGNWRFARDICRRYGRHDEHGIVWRSQRESIFVNSLGVMLDTVNPETWNNFLEERFLAHFVNQGCPMRAFGKLLVDATDATRFHKLVSLLRLTGSVGVRRLLEERLSDSQFGLKQLMFLEKTVFTRVRILESVRRQDWEGWETSPNGLVYPYDRAQQSLEVRSDILSRYRWVHVREYLAAPNYFREHSRLQTKAFRVVQDARRMGNF